MFIDLYKRYVRCHLEFSVPVWRPWQVHDIEILEKAQNEEDIIKQEAPGVEDSAVIVVECTTVKEEIKEENMDTEDPLSVQGKYKWHTRYIMIEPFIKSLLA